MKFRQSLLLIIFISLFTACSFVPHFFHILPEYQQQKINGKELLIVKMDSNNVFTRPLLNEPGFKDTFISRFEKGFESAITDVSSFNIVSTRAIKNRHILERREYRLADGEGITLLLPTSQGPLYSEDDHIMDYLLIISKLELTSGWVEEPFGPYEAGCYIRIDYAIWDNYQGRIVCYGKSHNRLRSFSLVNDPIIAGYYLKESALSIIKNSPFEKG